VIKLENISIPTNIRPLKKKTRLWIDNEILEIYGKKLKAPGIAIYSVLARHANSETQSCFPSYPKLMELSGIGKRNTISKYLIIIEELGLVIIKRNKKREPNFYFLINPLDIRTSNTQTYIVKKIPTYTKRIKTQYLNSTIDSTERDTLNQLTKSNKEVIDSLKEEYTNTKFKDFFRANPPDFLKGRIDFQITKPYSDE